MKNANIMNANERANLEWSNTCPVSVHTQNI